MSWVAGRRLFGVLLLLSAASAEQIPPQTAPSGTFRTYYDHPNSVYYDSSRDELYYTADRQTNYSGRLPTAVVPERYGLWLVPRLDDGSFLLEGAVTIALTAAAATAEVVLHARDLEVAVGDVRVADENGTGLAVTGADVDRDLLTVVLGEPLSVGGRYLLSLNYTGHLRDGMNGFYRSYYYDSAGERRWLAATQFSADAARKAFPCFDEPAFKARFQVNIARDEGRRSLSNMPVNESVYDTSLNLTWDRFEETPMAMSTYLVAFVVSDFANVTSSDGRFSTWQRSDALAQGNYSVQISPDTLAVMENLTGVDYFLPKMDQAAIPDFAAGAMENWGLILYRERNLLYEEGSSTASNKQRIAEVVAHELAHMWFGNLVTPQWWSYLWLSEGFATFFQYFAMNQVEPTMRLEEQFLLLQHHTAFQTDALLSTHPMTKEVSPTEIGTLISQIVYNKASSVLRMTQHFLTSKIFFAGLNRYLTQNANSTAVPADLFSALQEVHSEQLQTEQDAVNVTEVLTSWTVQPGYPVLSVTRNYSDGSAIISQRRFLLRSDEAAANSTDYRWFIPISFTSQQNPDFASTAPRTWLNDTEEQKTIFDLNATSTQWVLFNIQETGFYRVNYDADNWRLLASYLDSEYFDEIHVLNRAQLLDDALNLARAGQLNYSLALSLTRYLVRETDYIAWYPALSALSYLDQRLRALGSYPYHVFQTYVLRLLEPLYQSLGFQEREGDDHVTKLLRNLVLTWECNYGERACVSRSVQLFADFMDHGTSVPPDVRSVVYCNGLRYGGEREWQFLWDRLLDSGLSTEEGLIQTALGCSANETLAHRYLEQTVVSNSSIRDQDISSVFPAVLSQPTGVELAASFVGANYQRIVSRNNSTASVSALISQIATYVTSETQLAQLNDLVESLEDVLGSSTAAARASLQTAERNLNWTSQHGASVFSWLRQQDYRLPSGVSPLSYDVRLLSDLDSGRFVFDGSVAVRVNVTAPTRWLVLHANDLEINESSIQVEPLDGGGGVQVLPHYEDSVRQFYAIELSRVLEVGEYNVTMEFQGHHRDDMAGFYRSYYYRNGTLRWMASTQFQPTSARRAFPCFDEPGLKATFKIAIGRTADRFALSNMPLERSEVGENVTWDHFQETPMPMSTYLVAFVVSDFSNLSSSDGFYSTWQRPAATEQARYSIDVSPRIMSALENYTGVDYFLPKMDQVAVPDFSAGAMENWGLVTYRERLILVQEGVTSSADRQTVATVISHEFAHMWFGNLVSPAWWKYLWLSEGFARYFEFFTTHSVETSWRLDDQFVVRQVHSSLLSDSLETAHPLTVEVDTPASIENIFSAITYNKGASVIRMMEHFMTPAAFRRGLARFLANHGNGTAEPRDLFASLDEEYLVDFPERVASIEEVMNTWTLQNGYPLITVTRNYTTGAVTVSQARFLLQHPAAGAVDGRTWWVPITYTSRGELDFANTTARAWLNGSEAEVVIAHPPVAASDWVLFNVRQTGFYRVNYDSRNWELIAEYLNSDDYENIHLLNRAQLLDDAFNLARAGVIGYPVALRLTRYLSREVDYIPWMSALSAFNFVERRLVGLSQNDYQDLQDYVLGLLERVYQTVGLDEAPGDSHHAKLHRNQILTWACRFGDLRCINMSVSHFSRLMEDPDNYQVPPDLMSVVYCNGLRHGGEEEFDFLWNRYLGHNVNSEQVLILGAMGCTRNESLAHRLLRLLITENNGIRTQDESTIISSVVNNHYGVDFAINYLNHSFQDIIQFRNSTSDAMNLISSISGVISSQEQLDKLREIVEAHQDILGVSTSGIFSPAEGNLLWLSTHGPAVVSWLQQQNYRLPTMLVPDTYVIRIMPNFTDFTFEGSVTITITARHETDRVILHANDMFVDKERITLTSLLDGLDLVVEEVDEDSRRHFLTISLNQSLVAGVQYELGINYTGYMRDDMFGFYRSYYYQNGQIRWIGSTQFQPTHARRAFPCFDEPSFKAKFNMSINVPPGYHALFNTRKISNDSEVSADGRRWESFEQTPTMSTYLVAFVVSDFVESSNAAGNMSVWHRADARHQARYAVNVTQPIVASMEQLVGHDYQLSKLDQAAIPDFSAGAMENWGLVTYRERLILWDEAVSTTADKMNIATIIGHEVAHKWFGNLVTLSWWTYTWLNEGFATYFQTFAPAQVETDWRLGELFVVLHHQAALASDARATSRPMTHEVASPAQIWSAFDFVNYAKAGSVIRMMEHILTREVFLTGLHQYIDTHGYGNAEPDDLYASLQNASSRTDVSVKEVMDSWATQMGYPLVTITRNYSDNSAIVQQERFLLQSGSPAADSPGYTWWVPLTYTDRTTASFANTTPAAWLPAGSPEVYLGGLAAPQHWLLFNLQETGYYRVNYDLENWRLLTEQLRSEQLYVIPPVSRAQLLDDSLNLARAGLLEYSVALNLTTYLSAETDYVPWYSALTAFSFLDARLRGAPAQDYQLFTNYILNLTRDTYNSLGFAEGQDDQHTTKLLRSLMVDWACGLGLEGCVTWARSELARQMANSSYRILPDVSRAAYCTALRHGGPEEWEYLWRRFLDSNTGTEQVLLLAALGCTTDEATINRYLSLSINENSGIRSQDASSVFVAVYSNPGGVDIAFNFLVDNYRNISAFYGGMNSVGTILMGIAGQVSTRQQADALQQFVEENSDSLGTALDSSRRALESAEENLAWLGRHGEDIFGWLRRRADLEDDATSPITTSSTTPIPTTSSSTAASSEPPATDAPTQETTTPGSAGGLVVDAAVLTAAAVLTLLFQLTAP